MYSRHFNSFLSRCRGFCTYLSFSRKCSTKTKNFKLDNLMRYVGNEIVQKYFDKLQSDITFLTQNIDMSYASTHILKLIEERENLKKNLISINDWDAEKYQDKELTTMLEEEKISFESQLTLIECQLLDSFVPPLETGNEIILEITAGIGGKEAMLFAKEMYEMYCGYINYKSWSCTDTEIDVSPLGGVRHASMLLEGKDILLFMNQESGVHRIQRVPITERSGRIHTSTATVVVLPQPQGVDVKLDEKDLVIETKRASGPGGQHVNKTESAVRITHLPTGLSVESQTDRSQIKNRRVAYQRLCAKIMALQLQKQLKDADNSRKSQTGISARSDKIRTYNFLQDRITDHRLSRSFHNLSDFLKGGEELDSLIEELLLNSEVERINSFINDLPKCVQ